jgi:hypothetical protein
MQNAGDGRLKQTSPMLDSLPPFGSLGAPTERCLSKIAHWNDRASRGVALQARIDALVEQLYDITIIDTTHLALSPKSDRRADIQDR